MLFVRVFLIRTNVFDSYEYARNLNYTLVRDSYEIRNAVLAFVRVIFRTNGIRTTSGMRAILSMGAIDCNQWKRDFDNCVRFERNPQDTKSALELIESERKRRMERLRAHYGNDVWKKRDTMQEGCSKPLPEYLTKEYETS